MNRKQFAKAVASAYMDQWHPQEWRRDKVMNSPVIDYNTEGGTFSHCSSLTPAGDDVRVMELEDGMFGSERPTRKGIEQYIMGRDFDPAWDEIVDQINEAKTEDRE